jgi:ATP-binding cassette subfamily B protein
MSEAPTRKLDRELRNRIIALYAPHKREVILMMFVILGAVVTGLIPPILLQVIIDKGLNQANFNIITQYSLLSIFITILAAGLTLTYGWQSVVIGQKIMVDMRKQLFDHLQGMSLRFFTQTRTGDIQTRLLSDISGVQNVVSNTFTDALSNIAIVISAIVAMLWLDWRLTLLTFVLIPLFGFIGQSVGKFARDVRKGVQEQTSELNSLMQENLSVSGALLGKTIGRPEVIQTKFDVENKALADWQIKQSVLQYVFFGMIRMITTVVPALIYWFAGWLLFRGDTTITVGKLIAFSGLQMRMFFPLTGLMSLQVELLSSYALFERVFEYLDMKHDIVNAPDAKPLPRGSLKGDVKFEGVGFKYNQASEEWTLQDINLEARSGQLIALVGPSGAGKTTLTYMIPRLYDVDAGRVTIDGIDVREIKLESLHANVGMVTQETYLVHTTIRENLRLAKPEATDEELIAACKAAAIHDHIESLSEGYDTVVGERGYKLSGGEKQRLAIARAILKNPPILILDEATSSLDTMSERLIQQSLNTLMTGRTTFAIAHRLSTILNADMIIVLKDGQIVERGTHEELLKTSGIYKSLYDEQFSNPLMVAPSSN